MSKPMFSNKRFGGGGSGEPGASAYDIAVEEGFEGTKAEWLESLKGEQGPPGVDGTDGEQGIQGPPGNDGKDGEQGPPGNDGTDGKDGFGTEEQYNDIISRLEALEPVE